MFSFCKLRFGSYSQNYLSVLLFCSFSISHSFLCSGLTIHVQDGKSGLKLQLSHSFHTLILIPFEISDDGAMRNTPRSLKQFFRILKRHSCLLKDICPCSRDTDGDYHLLPTFPTTNSMCPPWCHKYDGNPCGR
jgi:hypothetical protein